MIFDTFREYAAVCLRHRCSATEVLRGPNTIATPGSGNHHVSIDHSSRENNPANEPGAPEGICFPGNEGAVPTSTR